MLQSPQCIFSCAGLDWDGATASGARTERNPEGLSVSKRGDSFHRLMQTEGQLTEGKLIDSHTYQYKIKVCEILYNVSTCITI